MIYIEIKQSIYLHNSNNYNNLYFFMVISINKYTMNRMNIKYEMTFIMTHRLKDRIVKKRIMHVVRIIYNLI